MSEEMNKNSKETDIREFVEKTPRESIKKRASRARHNYAKKNMRSSYQAFLENRQVIALLAYAFFVLLFVLAGTILCKNPVVWVCVLAVIETLLAACFHNLPVWFHAVVLTAEIICGAWFGQILFAAVMACLYLAALIVLRFVR